MTNPATTQLRIAELWRYPVKSLRGEHLDAAVVTPDGIRGDRIVHVRGPRGPLTGRTRHQLLTLTSRTGPDGEPLVNGHRWNSPQAAAAITAAAGPRSKLIHDTAPERFDVLPLLVATEVEIARLGVDGRRLRPNIVLAGAAPGEERDWPGHALRIGNVLIGIHSLRPRCIVTTIDPDTGAQDLEVLRHIRRDFDGAIALNCWVINGGTIQQHHPAQIVPLPREAAAGAKPGGWITGQPYPYAAAPNAA